MTTPDAAIDRLLDFLTVATHGVLYTHAVYPAALFEAQRRLGARVYIARHPRLAGYIAETFGALRAHLSAGHVDAVTVAVLEGPARTVVSRYVVRVRALTEAATAGRKERADAMARLDAQLQAHLLALYAAPAPPPRAEDERTFEIVVRASEAGVTPGGAWMAAAPSESGETAARVAARPLKDPDPAAALVSVQTYLEIPKLEPEGSASG